MSVILDHYDKGHILKRHMARDLNPQICKKTNKNLLQEWNDSWIISALCSVCSHIGYVEVYFSQFPPPSAYQKYAKLH